MSSLLASSTALKSHSTSPDRSSVQPSLNQAQVAKTAHDSGRVHHPTASPTTSDMSSLLASSTASKSHLTSPDRPSVQHPLNQAQAAETTRDCSRLHLPNTSPARALLHPLQDTDAAGYPKRMHAPNIRSVIEEGRKAAQEDFYRFLEDRRQQAWDAKKQGIVKEDV